MLDLRRNRLGFLRGLLHLPDSRAYRLRDGRHALPGGKRHLADLGGGQHLHDAARAREFGDGRLDGVDDVLNRRCD